MVSLRDKRIILDKAAIGRTLERMAMEVLERHQGGKDLALVGIHTAGVPLAHRLSKRIKNTAGVDVPVGMIDITLYRDDVFIGLPHPIVGQTKLPFDITGRPIVLVDGVEVDGRADGRVDVAVWGQQAVQRHAL